MRKGKRGPELNRRRADYGSAALPLSYPAMWSCGGRIRFLRSAIRLELAEAHGGAGDQIGLFLGQPIVPLGNSAPRKANRARQICGTLEQINGFGFGHGRYV